MITKVDPAIEKVIVTLIEVKDQYKALEMRKNALEDAVKKSIGAGKKVILSDGTTATVSHPSRITRLNGQQLKKSMPDVFDRFSYSSPTNSRLTITKPKQDQKEEC